MATHSQSRLTREELPASSRPVSIPLIMSKTFFESLNLKVHGMILWNGDSVGRTISHCELSSAVSIFTNLIFILSSSR